jgi:rhodanese-related sulfurtransferase
MQPKELLKQLKAKSPPTLLDVRSGSEYRMGHIPGAQFMSFWKVIFRLTGALPKDKSEPLVIYCESGPRAEMVGALLSKRGFSRISYLDGDMAGWRRAGLPLEK